MDAFFGFLSMIGTLILIFLVFAAAYYVSKLAGKKYQNSMANIENGIEIIDRKVISKDQSLMIIKTGDNVYLIGTTDSNINLIDQLDPEMYPSSNFNDFNSVDDINFKGILKKFRKDEGNNNENY